MAGYTVYHYEGRQDTPIDRSLEIKTPCYAFLLSFFLYVTNSHAPICVSCILIVHCEGQRISQSPFQFLDSPPFLQVVLGGLTCT
jgi:hypothetical protein